MRRAVFSVLAVGVALSLAACSTTTKDMPVPVASESSASASSKPKNVPKFDAKGTPKENLPYFLSVMNAAFIANTDVDTPPEFMAQALVNAGFDSATMQISENTTALGLQPDAKYVSVIFQGQCLVGTWGASMNTPTAVVLPVLPDGGCLLGGTVHKFN